MTHGDDEASLSRPLRDKWGLINRVRRPRGQVDAIERLSPGGELVGLAATDHGARGAINELMAKVLEEHVRDIYRRRIATPIPARPMPPRS
jgi:DNA-binding FrmR family transcriptional regulator